MEPNQGAAAALALLRAKLQSGDDVDGVFTDEQCLQRRRYLRRLLSPRCSQRAIE
ncbi:hypothetical protein [Mycobacterium uberis]|uniref:hypothetical protein n=1 Tax=Mycobacterium uberis TaxID=2162698 RepID=UPI003C77532F